MTAALYNEKGEVVRTWATSNREAAMTADRNCRSGWSVLLTEIAEGQDAES